MYKYLATYKKEIETNEFEYSYEEFKDESLRLAYIQAKYLQPELILVVVQKV